jgi:hypothetical protein
MQCTSGLLTPLQQMKLLKTRQSIPLSTDLLNESSKLFTIDQAASQQLITDAQSLS